MGRLLRLVLFGVAVWALPFALGMAIIPIVRPESALFDTLMSVVMSFAASLCSYLHLRGAAAPSLIMGAGVGLVWALMSVALDLPFFIFGPAEMRMAPIAYVHDVALTYLMIPIIAACVGHALRRAA